MERINILLLGAGNRVSLAEWLIAAGNSFNRAVKLFAWETDLLVPIAKYASILKGEKWDSSRFEESLINTIEHLNIHIVLPLMCGACTALASCKDKVEKETGAWLVVSDYNLCKTFEDKELANNWFISHQVRVPGSDSFPFIYKSKLGYGSRDQFICKNFTEFTQALQATYNLADYFRQNFIKGREYTVDCYKSRSGIIQGAVTRERLSTVNGEVSKGVTVLKPEIITEVNRILSLGKFEGPITFQFIEEESSGKFFIIECNPRAGGGIIQSLKAGANFCECIIAEFLGEPLPDCSNWQEGLYMLRANQEIWVTKG